DGRAIPSVGACCRWWPKNLAPQVLQPAQRLGGHRQAAPTLGGPVQDRPDQRQATLLPRQPADPLGPSAVLPEGPLDQVGVADALAVLDGEQQVDHERVQVVGHAGDRGRVQRSPLGDEPLGAPAGFGDGGLAVLLDVVEDGPVVPLHLVLGVGGNLGDEVAAHVDQTPLVQAGREAALDRRAQALPPSEMTSSGAPSPRSVRSASSSRQASVDSAAPGARPRNTGLPSTSIPQATSTGSALALGCILKKLPSRYR